jgi:hypothetical protein
MQPALFQQTTITQVQEQTSRALPGHGPRVEIFAVNDDIYQDEKTRL